jgi:two-component system chemotaxis response regulator CheY
MATIMIVDDDAFLHKVIERILVLGGHSVSDHAYNGAEAIEKYVALNPRPNIVLMDHRMPVMNGVTATREIREMDSHAVVVFISADNSVEAEAIEAGAVGFLTKPIRSKDLFDAIGKYAN